MTKLHSIVFEEIDRHHDGTNVFHTIYLFHHREPSYPTESAGAFDVCAYNPFKVERTPFFTIGPVPMRIVEYSTDVPIVVERESRPIVILMPGIHGTPLLTSWEPSESYKNLNEKIIGFVKESVLYFREFS
jgi:hypothetical protein